MEKNEEVIGKVKSLGSSGEGIISYGENVVFVPFVLPGETVKYKILKVKKGYAFGKAVEIIEKSEDRDNPTCPVFTKCGGCQLQHLKYEKQLKYKADLVKDCFKKIAFLNAEVLDTFACDKPFRYRNKLQIPVADIQGKTAIGFYQENSHRVIPIDDCSIQPKWAEKVIEAFKKYIEIAGIHGYDEERKRGDLRHIVVREVDGRFIITAVSTKKSLNKIEVLIDLLKERFTDFSLYINVNKSDTNVIFGESFYLIYGPGTYVTERNGIKFEMGAESFMQVNDFVSSAIYNEAVLLSHVNEKTVVIDAYSGAGLMTAMLAKKAKMAYGIEVVKEAVLLADKLKINNGLSDKMENILGKCEDVLPDLIGKLKREGESVSLVLDPPRKGCDIKVLQAIKKCEIDRIVYISCNPATLSRDVGFLCGTLSLQGNELKKSESPNLSYNVEYVRPFDMFPQTKHVETLVCLSRK